MTDRCGYVSRRDSHSSVPGVYGNGNPQRGDIFGTGQESDAPSEIRRIVPNWQGTASGRRLPQHTGNHPHSAGLMTPLNFVSWCRFDACAFSLDSCNSNQIKSNHSLGMFCVNGIIPA
jgi:hypothetical protein